MRLFRPDTSRGRKGWGANSDTAVRLIALAVFVLGLLNLWSSSLARGPGRGAFLHHTVHLPLVLEHASRTLIALFGVGLLMLARSLARHKRQAWWIALLLLVGSPLPHLAKGLDWEEALVSVALTVVLIVFRHAFYAENDRPSARQGLRAALALFAFALVYGPVGFYLLRDKFTPAFTWSRALRQTTHRLFYEPRIRALIARTPRAVWFDNSLTTVSVFSMGYGVLMLLRPVLPRERQGEQNRARIRRLLSDYPVAPISYFALLPDKQFLFDPADPSAWAVAYVVSGRVAVALGDPLGDPALVPVAVAHFLDYCRKHDWSPAFYQTTGQHLTVYREARLRTLKIGEDALIDLPAWSLKGKAFQDIRTALNKMARTGVTFAALDPAAPDAADTLTQMAAISDVWLREQKGEEKTFALGRFDPASDAFRDGRIFVARDETGAVLAFVTFVPIGGRGWGLDLMRRRPDTPNGLMEFVIASALTQFQAEGSEIASLGLSPLSGGACAEAGETELIVRGRALLYARFNLFYGFKGLHAFKEKFGPRWEARYLIYPGDTALAATVLAVIRAHSPRGLRTFIRR